MRNKRGARVPAKKSPNLGKNWNLRNCGTTFDTYTIYARNKKQRFCQKKKTTPRAYRNFCDFCSAVPQRPASAPIVLVFLQEHRVPHLFRKFRKRREL